MTPAAPARPPGDGAAAGDRSLLQPLVWAVLVTVLAAVTGAGVWSLIRAREAPAAGADALTDLGEVPPFTLTERSGRTVTRESLLGGIWIADFIFTRCTGVCPLLSGRMAALQRALKGRGGVTLVSFTVDPDWDTAEVLGRYAVDQGAEEGRWLFLTGARSELHRLIGEGFHLSVSRAADGKVPPGELVTHSDRLMLIDRRGRIRASYHGTEEETVERLLAGVDALARER